MKSVWVGVTVIPHAKKAHVKTFETEVQAEMYVDKAEAMGNERDYEVWTNIAESDVEFTEEPKA